jgi:hypothetical protein
MKKTKKVQGKAWKFTIQLEEVHGHMYKTKLNMYNKQIKRTWSLKDLFYEWLVLLQTKLL